MARTKKIITDIDKLHIRADETILSDEEKLKSEIKSLTNVLKANKDMVAICSTQLGFNSRIFLMKFANDEIKTFINPMITTSKGIHLSREKCDSIEGKEYIVLRNDEIQATYQLEDGKIESNAFQGTPSEVFQQMVNLLDGVLISDFGLEILEGWDEATQEERDEVINMYIDSIKKDNESLQEEIKNNEELKQINDAIEYMTGVATGKINVEEKEVRKPNRAERRMLAKIKRKVEKQNGKRAN